MTNKLSSKGDVFVRRVALSYSASALVLLLAGGLALYLMNQLGTAVDRTISDILPKTLVAMRLSEHSALLAASAPSLTNARDSEHTQQISAGLDRLKAQVELNVVTLADISRSGRLEHIKQNTEVLAETLAKLKSATIVRNLLDERHAKALARVRRVHSELEDTISPVVWGISSITRLFGKRTARVNITNIRALRDERLPTLLALLELQSAYTLLRTRGRLEDGSTSTAHDKVFLAAWIKTLDRLDRNGNHSNPVYRGLVGAGRSLSPDTAHAALPLAALDGTGFGQALSAAISQAHTATTKQFSETIQSADDTITTFADKAVRDMGYALNIKAEGSLLFATLTAASEADSEQSVAELQERFKRSHTVFTQSTADFQRSSLSKRNPILAGTVAEIEERLGDLGIGQNSLFKIRRDQLLTKQLIEELLANNRFVAARLNQEVDALVGEVQAEAVALKSRLGQVGGANRFLLVLTFLVGLLLTGAIAHFSIKMLVEQQREVRLAATVFESTGEGVIIMDPQSHIIAANEAFCRSSGHVRENIIGRHIRLLRSNRHEKAFYRQIMDTLAKRGHWQGEVYTKNRYGELELDWLTMTAVRNDYGDIVRYVAVFSDVEIVKRSLKKLDHLAHHDILTGLPNRLLLQDRLDHAIRRALRDRRRLAVLFLDLDRFKNINDTLGHNAGDELLRIASDRLNAQVRDGDTVARLGGDEFTILLEDYHSPEDARTVAHKLLGVFREPFLINDQALFVTASIGISVFPSDGVTADKLIRNADSAMYRAKEEGKNNFQFYTSDLTVAAKEKLRLESSLRVAMENDQFELHYQPKWDTDSGNITGVEALLRWQHPEYGLVGPDAFHSTLEDCGLILPLGQWILLTAARQARAWADQGLPSIQMSVNISGHQISQGNLLETVESCLADSRLPPHQLELEITEDFVMQQPHEVIELLNSIRGLGVRLAIDDFGTGYSSLSYLKQLPIQTLKIDRSFVADVPEDPDDVAITSAIIALALRLNMSVVAEGVETGEQLEFLRREGCDEAQGYLFSKPLPAEALVALLKRTSTFIPAETNSRRG